MSRREPDWIAVDEALARILDAVSPLPESDVPLAEALGLVLRDDVVSPIDQPPWDNSAMDGFAARAADVQGATETAPAELRVVADVPAGSSPARPLGAGEAMRVMTGAPVPGGADSVVRLEHTDAWQAPPGRPPYVVRVLRDDDAGRNIRARGEDLRRGVAALASGAPLRAGEIGLLASMGITAAPVHRRPRVAILSTGDELVEPDAIDEVMQGRAIVNSNSYALAAAVASGGGVPLPLGIARDSSDSIRTHVAAGLNADALVTTAGASVGDHDRVKDVLEELGFQLRFWRVRMRPGSPFSFGLLRRAAESGDTAPRAPLPVFGLPGNPVSALVTFEVLVRPALRRMLGRRAVHPRTIPVRLGERFATRGGLTHFLRARLERGDGQEPVAWLTGPQGSGILRSMSEAAALVVVPEKRAGLPAGAVARAIPLDAPDAGAAEPGFSP